MGTEGKCRQSAAGVRQRIHGRWTYVGFGKLRAVVPPTLPLPPPRSSFSPAAALDAVLVAR